MLLLLEIAADRVGHQVVTAEGLRQLFAIPVEENQALGVVDREGAKNDLIDKRVKGGGRSNAKHEREDGGDRECGSLAERADGEAEVVGEITEPAREPDVADLLLDLRGASEFKDGLAARLVFGEA